MRVEAARNIEDLRRIAARRLPRPVLDYLEGGADDELTLTRNREAFEHHALLPQALRDVSEIDLGTTLLGRQTALPCLLAPTGATKLFHRDGECAVARAAARAGVFYALSTMGNTSLENVAAVGEAPRIFQLYVFRDRGFTAQLVERCRSAGYHALCLTVDAAIGGNRERDLASGMTMPPRLNARSLLSFAMHPGWSLRALAGKDLGFPNFDSDADRAGAQLSAAAFFNHYFDRSVTWRDAEWLAETWGGPLVIKGLLSTQDVKRAFSLGASAVVISNHGGRQLDGTPAPMDRITAIRDAVGDGPELIIDGGIRRGTHILKALAAGASACAIGRPYLYGLAAAGETGVDRVLALLRSELERDMALLGVSCIADIDRHHLTD